MRDDEKLEITAGKIRKLAEKYEGVKEAFPEVFEEGWVSVMNDISFYPIFTLGGVFFISVSRLGQEIADIYGDGHVHIKNKEYRIISGHDHMFYKIEKKV